MRKLALALGAVAALSAPTLAADLPSSKAPLAPAFVAYNWTGFYVGLNAGAAFTSSGRVTELAPVLATDVAYNGVGFFAPLGDRTDFIGGIQVGYNYQISQFVIGVEADINYWNYRRTRSQLTVLGAPQPGIDNDTFGRKDANWLGTIRARLGVAFDRLLVYATGGVAFSDLEYSFFDVRAVPPAGPGLIRGSAKPDWGWTVGGGLEWAFAGNWSVKGEYLYTHFEGKTFRANILTAPGFQTRIRADRTETHIVRLGLNYRF